RRRHARLVSDWSSDVCSSDLLLALATAEVVDALRPLGQQRVRGGRQIPAGPAAHPLGHQKSLGGGAGQGLAGRFLGNPEARQRRSEERRVGEKGGTWWEQHPW